MALFDGLRRQLRSVIQWDDDGSLALFGLWSDNGDEIKNASKLIVGPGQGCIFVYEGSVRGVYTRSGMIDLATQNIPFWTTVSRAMQLFKSEHKVALYFFKTTEFLNQKWGTLAPVKYDDPTYHFPVGLKAFGNFSFRITEPRDFFVNVVGTRPTYTVEDFRQVMVRRINQPMADFLAESKWSYAQIDANREEIARAISTKIGAEFTTLGFAMTDFRIEGTDFDDETLRRIHRIADMSAEAQAAQAVGLSYREMQQIEALRDAARNEGGAAGIGVGLGAGMGMGQAMAGAAVPPHAPAAQPQCPDPRERLLKLKALCDEKLISHEEYLARKKEILDTL